MAIDTGPLREAGIGETHSGSIVPGRAQPKGCGRLHKECAVRAHLVPVHFLPG